MNKSKRNLLRNLALVGVGATEVSDKWIQPVVQSVILPAHAQTTGPFSLSFQQSGICGMENRGESYRLEIDDTRDPTGPFPITIQGPFPLPDGPPSPDNYVSILFFEQILLDGIFGASVIPESPLDTVTFATTCTLFRDEQLPTSQTVTGITGTTRQLQYVATFAGSPGSQTIILDDFSAS